MHQHGFLGPGFQWGGVLAWSPAHPPSPNHIHGLPVLLYQYAMPAGQPEASPRAQTCVQVLSLPARCSGKKGEKSKAFCTDSDCVIASKEQWQENWLSQETGNGRPSAAALSVLPQNPKCP